MNRATDREIADSLLAEWHYWSAAYRPKLGVPRIAPYCEQAVSNRQWEDSTEASCGRLEAQRMGSVEFCVDQLGFPEQRAIGLEMRNRQVKASVWREPTGVTYEAALVAIIPIMRKQGMFE